MHGLFAEGIRVLIVGLAREGTAVARFLAERGAEVTVTDIKSGSMLAASLQALEGLPITFTLGEHPLTLLDQTDLIFVSPGVPCDIPLLTEAQRRGLPLSSETRLFTRLCPAKILGVTGSSGKSTTTALVGEMLSATRLKTWVGGNIGRPLLPHLDEIVTSDKVVMELSSFQLEFFAPWPVRTEGYPTERVALLDPKGWSPHIAGVLNVTPNHLDRHPTMEAYIAAKAHILAYQTEDDIAVLGYDNAVTRRMGLPLRGRRRLLWFSMEQEVEEGTYLRGDSLVLRTCDHESVICHAGDIRLRGRHNTANVLAACALASAAGAPVEAMRQVASEFRGVEHRLEHVRDLRGVSWYNDSIATTPERTVAALLAFDSPIVLLAGGRDKHLPWTDMVALTWQKARHLILFGEAAALIDREMCNSERADPGRCQIHHAGTLARAVELAAQLAVPGDVVLLAPGGTSFDAYPDFAARGTHFRQLVLALE